MKKNQAALLVRHQEIIDEVKKKLLEHIGEIVKALSKRNRSFEQIDDVCLMGVRI